MFDIDLLIALVFMALLFLRHVAILKKPNKINYAPLMIAIGAIASLIHFMIHPDPSNVILLLRESLMPILVATILYTVMNILNQTKESESAKLQDEFTKVLVHEITQLKEFILELEARMTAYSQEDREVQKEIRAKFKDDIKALESIEKNQIEFIKKFENMQEWHENVDKAFTYFSEVQMPELDKVVHKHIDMLRISEQDHYSKLSILLEKIITSREDIDTELMKLKANLESIQSLSTNVAKDIVDKTYKRFSGLTQEFEAQLVSLKLHAEGVKTSLYEDENVLNNIRTQSEIIMKQMKLSARQMDELEKRNSNFSKLAIEIRELVVEIEKIKSDYVKAQAELSQLSRDLQSVKEENFIQMQEKIDHLKEDVSSKIDSSLEKLYEHYHMASENITQSVKIMAKKAQLKKGYGDFEE